MLMVMQHKNPEIDTPLPLLSILRRETGFDHSAPNTPTAARNSIQHTSAGVAPAQITQNASILQRFYYLTSNPIERARLLAQLEKEKEDLATELVRQKESHSKDMQNLEKTFRAELSAKQEKSRAQAAEIQRLLEQIEELKRGKGASAGQVETQGIDSMEISGSKAGDVTEEIQENGTSQPRGVWRKPGRCHPAGPRAT